jgi:hypothetical protein
MPQVNTSPRTDCWRLVHDGTKVLALFQSTGITQTINNLFCGTEAECQAKITELHLTPLPAKDTLVKPASPMQARMAARRAEREARMAGRTVIKK